MSTLLKKYLDKGVLDVTEELQKMFGRIKQISAESRQTDFDYNNQDVIYSNIQHLEWLYGRVYRLKTKHFFCLHGFGVNKTDLTDNHKKALDLFNEQILLLYVLEHNDSFGINRSFHDFENPFPINISIKEKKEIISKQKWASKDSPDIVDKIKAIESDKFLKNNKLIGSHSKMKTYFPVRESFTPKSQKYEQHYKYFLIEKLFYLGHTEGQKMYPFSKIVGRASKTGPEKNNATLSKKRAQSVFDKINENFTKPFKELSEPVPIGNSVIAEGDPSLLVDNNNEERFNRSVCFSFDIDYDYVHLFTPEELKDNYKKAVNSINETLSKRIKYLEEYNLNPTPLFDQSVNASQKVIMEGLRFADRFFSLGMHSINFVKKYDGNLEKLKGINSIPNNPKGLDLADQHMDSPEFRGTARILPLAEIIFRGSYSNSNLIDFKLPRNPKDRLKDATVTFALMKKRLDRKSQGFSSTFASSRNYLNRYKSYIVTDYVANSFLMVKLNKEEYLKKIEYNSWKFKVNFKKNTIYSEKLGNDVELLVYPIESGFLIELVKLIKDEVKSGGITNYYWFDEEIRDFHYDMRKIIAKNAMKTLVLSGQTNLIGKFNEPMGSYGVIGGTPSNFPNMIYSWVFPSIGKADW